MMRNVIYLTFFITMGFSLTSCESSKTSHRSGGAPATSSDIIDEGNDADVTVEGVANVGSQNGTVTGPVSSNGVVANPVVTPVAATPTTPTTTTEPTTVMTPTGEVTVDPDKLAPELAAADAEVQAVQVETPIGIKSGTQIYQTFVNVTGVDESDELQELNLELQSSLPAYSHKLSEFGSGHVASIFKLAVRVCNDLVEDDAATSTFFQGCNINQAPSNLGAADKDCVAGHLASKFWGAGTLDSGMGMDVQKNEVITTIDEITAGMSNANQVDEMPNLLKAVCAHTAGSLPSILL